MPTLLIALLLLSRPALAEEDAGATGAPPAPDTRPLHELTEVERRARIATLSKAELATVIENTPVQALVKMGQRAVAALGTYSYTMKKQERVGGTLLDEQEISTTLREAPFAVRLDFVAGPAKGRRLIYNPAVRPDEFRVREAGFFSIAGRMWISFDSGLAKRDSNRTVKESGFGSVLRTIERDQLRAKAQGGPTVKHEGWDTKGRHCTTYVMPNQGVGFDSASTRICTDVATGLPMRVEGYDAAGTLRDRFEFSNVKKVSVPPETFDPEKGL